MHGAMACSAAAMAAMSCKRNSLPRARCQKKGMVWWFALLRPWPPTSCKHGWLPRAPCQKKRTRGKSAFFRLSKQYTVESPKYVRRRASFELSTQLSHPSAVLARASTHTHTHAHTQHTPGGYAHGLGHTGAACRAPAARAVHPEARTCQHPHRQIRCVSCSESKHTGVGAACRKPAACTACPAAYTCKRPRTQTRVRLHIMKPTRMSTSTPSEGSLIRSCVKPANCFCHYQDLG
eukprot:1145033-Pelagomonas_calceolata.AAC.6